MRGLAALLGILALGCGQPDTRFLQPEGTLGYHSVNGKTIGPTLEVGHTRDGDEYCMLRNVPGPSAMIEGGFSNFDYLSVGCRQLTTAYEWHAQANPELSSYVWTTPNGLTTGPVEDATFQRGEDMLRDYLSLFQVQQSLRQWRNVDWTVDETR